MSDQYLFDNKFFVKFVYNLYKYTKNMEEKIFVR